MKKYAGFRNGYVRVRIYGEQTERFLNLCRAREIRISDLRRESELSLTGCLQIRDFFRLAPIHRKTKVKIHILEKHGLPFFFYRSKKRKAFFLGLLLCAGLLLFLSGRLWEIDVEGNVRNSTPEILDFLEQKGIRHGMAKGRLSCSEIAAEIRKKYPDITWVSAKLEGTRLLLTVREGIFIQTTEEKDKSACDIMAERDGEIIKMITRSGLPRKKVGDLCKKGEILVSGMLPADSQYACDQLLRHPFRFPHSDYFRNHAQRGQGQTLPLRCAVDQLFPAFHFAGYHLRSAQVVSVGNRRHRQSSH